LIGNTSYPTLIWPQDFISVTWINGDKFIVQSQLMMELPIAGFANGESLQNPSLRYPKGIKRSDDAIFECLNFCMEIASLRL